MESHSATADLVLSLCILLLLAAATLAASRRIHLPFTILLVLVGIAITQLTPWLPEAWHRLLDLQVSPDLILYVFLPSLIFESALHLDARQLRDDLAPVLGLAIPGLLISTVVIAVLVAALTQVPFAAALLLGAILSATDPVAVIALFHQLGAPHRLTVLVEGESLLNDATALVAAKILLGVATAGYFSAQMLASGVFDFVTVFLGGILVGWLLAIATGFILGAVHDEPAIEISLLTALAYLSFLIGEEVFHVSGVMATVAAGLTIGNWGRAKISPAISVYIEHFWEYVAFVANALIFLLVGLTVDVAALVAHGDVLLVAVVAMTLSRALVIYTLVPLLGRLPRAAAVDRTYQTVMFWGGLRGAVALAVVLSLGDFEWSNAFTAVVMGAVLFTLVVQGLTMAPLMHRLHLDEPSVADRLSRDEARVESILYAVDRIPELGAGGLFSVRIAQRLQGEHRREIDKLRATIQSIRRHELTPEEERRLLFLRCLATEKTRYYELYSGHHITEEAYRALDIKVTRTLDQVRHHRLEPAAANDDEGRSRNDRWRQLETVLPAALAEKLRLTNAARAYEISWAEFQAGLAVDGFLEQSAGAETLSAECIAVVRERYSRKRDTARAKLDDWAAQFPEFVAAMQERLAERLTLHVERDAIAGHLESGVLAQGVGHELLSEFDSDIRSLGGVSVAALKVDQAELCRTVPFFAEVPAADMAQISSRMKPLTVSPGADIVRQGEPGASMYFIARGVVRVMETSADGRESELATLLAGDFFGEMAILHDEPRSATCRAATACALYELNRGDVDEAVAISPVVGECLRRAAAERAAGEV